ncbi:MAG: S8 family serine peptidase, partial [Ginsengibacter sp.]
MKKWIYLSKTLFFCLILSFCFKNVSAQFTRYVIKFKDKTGTPFSISNPSQFLSPRAVERRNKQHILIDETDLPIVPRYIDSVRLSGDVKILNSSKWLNQVCIETSDAAALTKINSFSFVENSDPVKKVSNRGIFQKSKFAEDFKGTLSPASPSGVNDFYNYGNAFGQIHIHEGEYLHNKGFHGEGLIISVIDAGFYHYQSLPAFDSINQNHQVIETYDFVNNKVSVNEEYFHGMSCLSIMAGNIPGQLVGTAPKAKFLLYMSEDVYSESPVEEQNWAAAAERSDSAGADIITTSLGYSTFDNPLFNHTYADMNGHTTIIARAAKIAARKGMILLVAAGNEGNSSWHYITTPADTDSILTVGAVDVNGNVGSFSSYGPSSDGRIKPTIASVGVATFVSTPSGAIAPGNGTSYATPNVAGLVTCLWQAFPGFTSNEIMAAVIKSSSNYSTPDARIGYGIPDFRVAYQDLLKQQTIRNITLILGNDDIKVFPNPFGKMFSVVLKTNSESSLIFQLSGSDGKIYLKKNISIVPSSNQLIEFNDLPALSRGIYFLKIGDG